MRELTLAQADIQHPQVVNGRNLWIAPEVQDIIDRLQNGDPSLGWEGDPRLALYRTKDDRWELWRLEADDRMQPVCRSRPGLELDAQLIMHLVGHDLRRGHDLVEEVDLHNLAVDAARDAKVDDKLASATDKLLWALRRDTYGG